MVDKPVTTEIQTPPIDLRQIFNDFAQKAETDFPSLHDRLLVYHYPTGELFGSTVSESQGFSLDDKRGFVKRIDTIATDSVGFSPGKNRPGFTGEVDLKLAPNGRFISDPIVKYKVIFMGTMRGDHKVSDDPADVIRGTLEHELGHQVVPEAYQSTSISGVTTTPQFRENAADTFSLIRQLQAGGNLDRAADNTAWRRDAHFLLTNVGTHLTTPSVEGLKDLASRHDLTQLSPAESANLAYRVALEHTPDAMEMQKLKDIFKPVREAYASGGMDAAAKATAEIMKQDHGALNDRVFGLGKTFLEPALKGKAQDLTITIKGNTNRLDEVRTEGKYWDGVRAMIDKKDMAAAKKMTTAEARLDQEARDLKLLGKFDKDPSRIIPPEERLNYKMSQNVAEESYKAARRAQAAAPVGVEQQRTGLLAKEPVMMDKTAVPSGTPVGPVSNPLPKTQSKTGIAVSATPEPEIPHKKLVALEADIAKPRAGLKGGGIAAGFAMAAVSGIAAAAAPDATPGKVMNAAIDTAVPGWVSARKGEACAAFGEVVGVTVSGAAMVATTAVVAPAAVAVTAVSGPAAPLVGPLAAVGAAAAVAGAGAGTYSAVAPGAEATCNASVNLYRTIKNKIGF